MNTMQNPNMRCFVEACARCAVPYTIQDEIGNWVTIHCNQRDFHFIRTKTPFNSSSLDTIFRDKEYTYRLLHKEIPTPETVAYLDPRIDAQWQPLVVHKTQQAIHDDIVTRFGFPVIIKRNSGAQGDNVFKANTIADVDGALTTIFNAEQKNYDILAIAQPYIDIAHEYRVLWFNGEVVLVYEKVAPSGKHNSLSPLANQDSFTRIIAPTDAVYTQIEAFLTQSPTISTFMFCGFDIAIDTQGVMWLIEVNGWPGTSKCIRDNGDEPIIEVYMRMLKHLQQTTQVQ